MRNFMKPALMAVAMLLATVPAVNAASDPDALEVEGLDLPALSALDVLEIDHARSGDSIAGPVSLTTLQAST